MVGNWLLVAIKHIVQPWRHIYIWKMIIGKNVDARFH